MSAASRHIVILCSRLDVPGGIERAIVNTANLFASHNHSVTLLVLEEGGEPFYPVDSLVILKTLPLHFGIREEGNTLSRKIDFIRDLKTLRKALTGLSPDVVIGTQYNYSTALVLAYKNKGARLYAWEHHHFYHLQKSLFWKTLFTRTYPKLNAVVCLNPKEADAFAAFGCKTVVIPNFVEQATQASLQNKTLLTVGWLSKVKGVNFIPLIAEKVFHRFPDWQWKMIGVGNEEKNLKKEINSRNLQNNVFVHAPATHHLEAVYDGASVYVMASQFECFPMVLLEAMSHGIPCVSFDCPTGPAFIITDNVDGLLVEQNNTDAMAEAICNFILDEKKRIAFGNAALQNIDRFSPEKVYKLWQPLFAE